MKVKTMIKFVIDLILVLLLFIVTAYHLEGNLFHEIVGVIIFVVFVLHNVLNFRFYTNLFKGKYNATRSYRTAINILLLLAMVFVMVSSMMISGKVLVYLNFGDMNVGRKVHMVSNIWCFMLTSIHFGFHVKQIITTLSKGKHNAIAMWICRAFVISLSIYGVCAFVSRELYVQAFGLTDFLFLPYGESIWKYGIDYFSVFVLFACLSHCFNGILLHIGKNRKTKSITEV